MCTLYGATLVSCFWCHKHDGVGTIVVVVVVIVVGALVFLVPLSV